MFAGIKGIAYALLFVGLFAYFIIAGYMSKLIDGIIYIKNMMSFIIYFLSGEPLFGILAGLVSVVLIIMLVMAWKNTD